jgi:hypothetical protein
MLYTEAVTLFSFHEALFKKIHYFYHHIPNSISYRPKQDNDQGNPHPHEKGTFICQWMAMTQRKLKRFALIRYFPISSIKRCTFKGSIMPFIRPLFLFLPVGQ